MREFKATAQADKAVEIYSDSMAALEYAKDSKYHGRTKHIDICYHYIRNMVRQVTLKHISTNEMVADLLTKAIARDLFLLHVKSLGLRRF